ncbi:plexin-B1 isoform X2 [Hemiscyllium ocellatum]|uniref:plexin-B1 isoform X2 n=1 Tax=Hemiscyllium ocellatum TaxID=170820 RepID=UPI0029670364|nr:plexin-B1 isoform X2 [Hemiscyllium ocellatum]
MRSGNIFLSIVFLSICRGDKYKSFSRSDVKFEHLTIDPETGNVYIGAVNFLFQLTSELTDLVVQPTGPQNDSKDCLPPVNPSDCPHARLTDNHNKLLLTNPYGDELITCGSLFQGICEKRSLGNISRVLFRPERPVDTQYVAANDPNVTTVGLVGLSKGKTAVLFVGRGYTSKGAGGIPPITTRNLELQNPQSLESHPIFSYEDTAKLAVAGRLSEYNHHFVKSFIYQFSVYFLFYRRDLKSSSREYKTYVSRICLGDMHYYSYVEVPLVCQTAEKNYNLLQAAYVSWPGKGLAKGALQTNGEVLFATFAVGQTATAKATEESALCIYTMNQIDQMINQTRDQCYTNYGKVGEKAEAAYIEYEVKSSCSGLTSDTLNAYPCGYDHTPSPMASRIPIEAALVLKVVQGHLVAVAVTVEMEHTIVFLGDAKGRLHKVFVKPPGEAEQYATVTIQPNAAVNSDLVFDREQKHLYVTTQLKVLKLPVSECFAYTDCQSCLVARDPYCGWCILQGRCCRRSECERAEEGVQWLWSYEEGQQCLSVQTLIPANISRQEQKQVFVNVADLPVLAEGESYTCLFDDYSSPAVITERGVVCWTPNVQQLPPTKPGTDHVTVRLKVMFFNIILTAERFTFYDCAAVQQLSRNFPCRGCVSSQWGCNWCVLQHHCTHNTTCEDEVIIFNENNHEGIVQGPADCPCVNNIQGSPLLPVNTERKITLVGRNLHFFQDPEGDYECVFVIESQTVVVEAIVEGDIIDPTFYSITCQVHQFTYATLQQEYNATVYVQRRPNYRVDSGHDLHITLYNCSVDRTDCSRCQTAETKYACVWCGGGKPSCVYEKSCVDGVEQTCPAPFIHSIDPTSGLQEGGTMVTITGSNLGQRFEDIQNMVTVAGIPCRADPLKYEVSTRIVCYTAASNEQVSGQVTVEVVNGGSSSSAQPFTYQNPVLDSISPSRGPKAGGTHLTLKGVNLLTGRPSDVRVFVGDLPCLISDIEDHRVQCLTTPSNQTDELPITVKYGDIPKRLNNVFYSYTENPNITSVRPDKSFLGGGRVISINGQNLDAVQTPQMMVQLIPNQRRQRSISKRQSRVRERKRRMMKDNNTERHADKFTEFCQVNSSFFMTCKTPSIKAPTSDADITVHFLMDNLCFDFNEISPTKFTYKPDPILKPLNAGDPSKPYRHKPGSVLSVEGENLDLAITKEEVVAMVGEGICVVRTLTANHLYCEPPLEQPAARRRRKRESLDTLPEFIVQMGKLHFKLGKIRYDAESQSNFPLEAQIGLGVGASIVALIVLIIVLIYRRKSKQALRDYKKVQIQLENLETSVRDRCKKEFTDLMTEMMDLSSDLVGTGIPFLDYKTYAERIFFPGHRESPLQRDLDVPESRRQTVEQGLVQLSNLLNSKLFLTKFIHTLESQRTFSPRDRAYVASLLTVSLHGKLEYYTDILKTLLNDLVEQNVAKNPKLMLRRTETVVEKLLTNWMSICLYTFLRDSAGESLYMLFRAIKHQVDKGPVDAVSGKAKYTLNDNRLLREDVEYRTLTLNVLVQGEDVQPSPVKVLDCDTITQVKEKIIDQIYKGVTYSLRPHVETLDLEWRSGLAGHLILSDEDLTSVLQGNWKRLNTLQHYKVTDGATVALVPRLSKHIHHENHDFTAGEKTPMLEDADEGGIKVWHLVKASEEPELPKHRRGSLRERERAKAIPEIYLTRLLSMKGTLQKFVDDLFQVILSTSRPVPLAVKYFFDLLDEQAVHHGITDTETIHIWKTNSLPLRFWINIIKNPHFTFDVQVSDNVDAMLSVIAQTFMDSCTIAEHKLGRDSPINKLLYARDIPRYKQMVERYYADIRQTISASDQEMNSALAELSRNYSSDMNSLVALHELYKYINKYYDQIITALEEDPTAQKMQLGYRLQQIAASVENKVTDL